MEQHLIRVGRFLSFATPVLSGNEPGNPTVEPPKQDVTLKHVGRAVHPAVHARAKSGRATRLLSVMAISGLWLALAPSSALAAGEYVVKPVAQKKLKELPPGPLYWRVENFPTLADAQAAVGPDGWNPASVRYETKTSLIAEVGGKVWVVTLGPKGASTPGGSKVAEVGPVPALTVPEYLLRLNHGSGPAGAKTPVHSHPGSEAFYVVTGRLGQRTAHGVSYADAGRTMNGHAPDMAMEVFNAGSTELSALIMFVVDATRPFSVPASFD